MVSEEMASAGGRFKALVEEAMTEAGLSLSALARDTGIDRGAWYSWFRGERAPQPRTLRRASHALNRTVSQLREPWGASLTSIDRSTTVEDALRDALAIQMAAISELVGLLRPIVEQAGDREARLRAVESELQSLRAQPEAEGSPRRRAPRATAG